jgi:hypothetical protein
MSVRLVVAWIVVALATTSAQAISQFAGTLGSTQVDPSFAAATAAHAKHLIDFDQDGFVLSPHAFTPIQPDHYSELGVTLLNLDARSVGELPWAHSPPIGAWHTGFDASINEPYSFVFASPVASFGLFANDVEAPIVVTVHSQNGSKTFEIPFQGGAELGRFVGYVADANEIQRIDFATTDYHLIDDVQFGYLPEPAAGGLMLLGWLAMTSTIRFARRGDVAGAGPLYRRGRSLQRRHS